MMLMIFSHDKMISIAIYGDGYYEKKRRERLLREEIVIKVVVVVVRW